MCAVCPCSKITGTKLGRGGGEICSVVVDFSLFLPPDCGPVFPNRRHCTYILLLLRNLF